MAADVYIDRVDTLSCTERLGVVRQLVRKVRVKNIAAFDYTILTKALDAAGVPRFGDVLDDTHHELNMLVLVERTVALVEEDTETVDVTCTYEHLLDGAHQNVKKPLSGILYGKSSSSVQQKTTNFYREAGIGPVKPIIVGHTYPKDDPEFGNKDPKATTGKYLQQGGEVNVMFPQETYKFEGYINTSTPWLIRKKILNHINSEPWLDAGVYEWMCTAVEYELLQNTEQEELIDTVSVYKFSFEFQHNTDTWNPTAVFIDPNTNKPPSMLEPGPQPPGGLPALDNKSFSMRAILNNQYPGYMYVRYHKERDFNKFFGALIEGWVAMG